MSHLKEYLVKNDLEGLFRELDKAMPSVGRSLNQELDVLKNQWYENEKKQRLSLISQENYQLVRNRTISGLSHLIHQIEEAPRPSSQPPHEVKSSGAYRPYLLGGALVIALLMIIIAVRFYGKKDLPRRSNNQGALTQETLATDAADQNEVAIPSVPPTQNNAANDLTDKPGNTDQPQPTVEQKSATAGAVRSLFSKNNTSLSIAWTANGQAQNGLATALGSKLASKTNVSTYSTAKSLFYQEELNSDILSGNDLNLGRSNVGNKLLVVVQGRVKSQMPDDAGNVFAREELKEEHSVPIKLLLFSTKSGSLDWRVAKTFKTDVAKSDLNEELLKFVGKLVIAQGL